MTKNKNIEKIKNTIVQNVGNNFDIVAKHGRKKILFENCTVDSAYPSIFIVKASGAKAGIKGSVSYQKRMYFSAFQHKKGKRCIIFLKNYTKFQYHLEGF